jgi:hypothetical protein
VRARNTSDRDPAEREVYFEFIALGRSVRVAAIDSVTGIEVTIVGPAGAARADLERVALRKLMVRLSQEPGGRT